MSFKKFYEEESAGTTSADIATVDNKLGSMHKSPKGKKCKEHHKINCDKCNKMHESHWN